MAEPVFFENEMQNPEGKRIRLMVRQEGDIVKVTVQEFCPRDTSGKIKTQEHGLKILWDNIASFTLKE